MLLTKDHITFIIGNDQILQNKLESAVSEITRFQFLSKSNWSDIFISLLPIIIIWCLDFYHEKNVRRSGGGSGQIFNIGKSKAKLLMKKQM
jgi:cell division protease FtsH